MTLLPARLGSLAAALLAALTFSRPAIATEIGEYDQVALVRRVMPSVVNIQVLPARSTAFPEVAPGQARPDVIVGSGFVIDPSGLIVTNRHLLAGARRILVTLNDGEGKRASVIRVSHRVDLAVLRVETASPLQAVTFADSDQVAIGEPVLAIGNPLGFGGSVTSGIVSGLNRDIRSSPFDEFIQTDAAINHGSSGGPLFDRSGQVVGMNTALESPTGQGGSIGIGFAMPSNEVQLVANILLGGRKTPPGWLGLSLQPVYATVAEAFGLDSRHGAIVAAVVPDGPGSKAGVTAGDVILAIDGQPVDDVRAVLRMAAIRDPGSSVMLTIWQNGAKRDLPITLGAWPEPVPQTGVKAPPRGNSAAVPDYGLSLEALTAPLRRRFGVPADVDGVLVAAVDPNGAAGETRLRAGDVISRIQQTDVSAPAQALALVDAAKASGKPAVALLVNNRGQARWVGMPIQGNR